MKKLFPTMTTVIQTVCCTLVVLLSFVCCAEKKKLSPDSIFDEASLSAGEQMLKETVEAYDFKRMMTLADSLQKTGDISAVIAHYYHGAAAIHRGRLKEAEEHLKAACSDSVPDVADMRLHLRSKALLARVQATEGDYEGALSEALPALAMMDSLGNKDFGDMTQLLIVIGECQQNLHMPAEAALHFAKAYALLQDWMKTDTAGTDGPRCIIRIDNISSSYISTADYARAKMWLEREDSALAVYKTKPAVIEKQANLLKGSISLDLAEVCERLGLSVEAARHYDEHRKTIFSTYNVALINACDYLMAAGRYAEAADNYAALDLMFVKRDYNLSLDNIGKYLLPKMKANALAGRKDSAIAVGMQIAECFDSVLTSKKEESAAELATVYDTQGKERQIAEQQARLQRVRVAGLIVSIIALTVFFVVFTIIRYRAAKRLAKVTAAKERMEGELSIARSIQMSMVPGVFPDYPGLDMFASMMPAKEVGGDLYGYVQKGDTLYFAVGDVSGKGVPASLFMAQATRLFITLANQGMMPADICTHLNEALSGTDNEKAMFVTMFVGLLDLKTGRLDFCNAGHNAPFIGIGEPDGGFMRLKANTPIGLWPGLEYVGEQLDSIKGRPLFIYTDGLNEAEDSQHRQFGNNRLAETLRSLSSDSSQQVVEAMKAEVERHRGGAEPNDDLTMMCLKIECLP